MNNTDNFSELYKKIQDMHEADEHHQIIELIKSTDCYEQDFQLVCVLARAYNCLEDYDEAIFLLESIEEEGKNDALWNYRLGYSYFYKYDDLPNLEKSLELVQRGYDLGDELALEQLAIIKDYLKRELNEEEAAIIGNAKTEVDDAYNSIEVVKEHLGYDNGKAPIAIDDENQEYTPPLMYDGAEMEAVEAHVKKYFGNFDNVLHEIMSLDLHIDLLIIEPRLEHDYYTIVTMGSGAYEMSVPEDANCPRRIELMINLPKDWNIHSEDEKDYWPLRWLKILARFSINENTWLAWGHTIPAGRPLAENTELNCIMLTAPEQFGNNSVIATLPNGEEVAFWQIMPLYEDEVQFKLRYGAQELERKFEEFPAVIDLNRPCVCEPLPLKYYGENRRFDKSLYLQDMYKDDYYPDFLVDKIKALIAEVVAFIEYTPCSIEELQEKFNIMTVGINELEEEFEENDSEIETGARESIGATIQHIIDFFELPIDCETAIQERDW